MIAVAYLRKPLPTLLWSAFGSCSRSQRWLSRFRSSPALFGTPPLAARCQVSR